MNGYRPDGIMEPGQQRTDSSDPLARDRSGIWRLFVYGTLKRGCRNHDLFCRGLLSLREAQIRGRLYDGPGYPLLEVPDEDILAQGTSCPSDDVATQERVAGVPRSSPHPLEMHDATGEWGAVYGELLSFEDPESRLPAIDGLEGFHPGGRSLYRRVLVPVLAGGDREVAWVYIVEMTRIKQRRLPTGRWPGKGPSDSSQLQSVREPAHRAPVAGRSEIEVGDPTLNIGTG